MSEENVEMGRPGKTAQRLRSIPLGVRVAVFLAVLVAMLLPFALQGKVAHWAAVASIVLMGVGAIVATVVISTSARRRPDSGAGPTRGRRLVGVAVSVAALIFAVVTASQREESNREPRPPTGEQIQKVQETLNDCSKKGLSAKACVRRALRGTGDKPADKGAGLRE